MMAHWNRPLLLTGMTCLLFGQIHCGSSSQNNPSNPDQGLTQTDSQGASSDSQATIGEEVRSTKQRLTSPQAAEEDLQKQVAGNNAFAFDLYQQIRSGDNNLFYSPHSITLALAMLYGGAKEDTEKQIAQVLHYDLPQDKLHAVFNALDLELAKRGQNKKGADGEPFRLRIANAIWGQKEHPFLSSYLDLLALNYGAGLRVLDFVAQPDPSRILINQWVEQQTEGRIKNLLPQGSVDSLTRLVLTNAIYFNAAWSTPFETKNTADKPFYLLDNSSINVATMHGVQPAQYAKDADYQAVAIPYDGSELSMLVIVPEKGKFASFEQSLSGAVIDDILSKMTHAQVTLQLPKFSFTVETNLKEKLQALGMSDAFTAGKANFSGIDGQKELFVTGVFHKAFIKVNEAGTEAAAATGIVAGTTSVPQLVTLNVDRPFIFLIRDHATKAILFAGRVLNPAE